MMKICFSLAFVALGSNSIDAFTTTSSSLSSPKTWQTTELTSKFPAPFIVEKRTATASSALFSKASFDVDALSNQQPMKNGSRLAMKRVSRFFLLLVTALTIFASGWSVSSPAAQASSTPYNRLYQTTQVSVQSLTPKQKALRMKQLQQRQQKIQKLTPAQRRKLLQKRQKILQQQQQHASFNAAVDGTAGYYGQQHHYGHSYHPAQQPFRRGLTSWAAGSLKVGILAVALSAAVMMGSQGMAGNLRDRLSSLLAPRSHQRRRDEVSPTSNPRRRSGSSDYSPSESSSATVSYRINVDRHVPEHDDGRHDDTSTAYLVMNKKANSDTPSDILPLHDDTNDNLQNFGILDYDANDNDPSDSYLTYQGPREDMASYMNDQIIPERDGDLAEPFVSPIKMIQPNPDDTRKPKKATLYRQSQLNGQVPFAQEFELQGDSDTIMKRMRASRSREEPTTTTVRRPRAPGSMLRKSEDDDYYQHLEQQEGLARSKSSQILGLQRGGRRHRYPTESLLSRGRTETSQPLAVSSKAYINTATDDSSRHFALSYMFNKFLAKKMRNPVFDNVHKTFVSGAQEEDDLGYDEGDQAASGRLLP